ncbi:MAG: hypothetical protein WEB06_16270 [Actinomycetota bacterium]
MSDCALELPARIIDSRDHVPSRIPLLAASCSLVAAVVHAWVVRSHLTHWWAYGAFFAVLAIAQAGYAVLVIRRPTRRLALAGMGTTAAVLVLYAWSRTIGVPIGPHAGRPEPVGTPDLLAAAAELALIVSLLFVGRTGSAEPRFQTGRWGLGLVVVALSAAGLAGPVGHHNAPLPGVTLASAPAPWLALPPPVATPVVAQSAEVPDESIPVPEEPAPCVAKAAPGLSVPGTAPPGEARAIAYSHEANIWMLDPSDEEVTRLTDNGGGPSCWARSPVFRSDRYVSFSMNEGYYGLDLKTGALEELPLTNGWIQAAAWSPDGDALAYLTGNYEDAGIQLALFRPEDGTKKILRTFVPGPGSCGSADGEVSVSWAPDGHALIVVITHLENQDETMFVLDPAGKDMIEPRSGTNARWAPNSKRIYYREMGGDQKWFALNSETGDRGTLGAMKPGTYNLAVSPDGTLLAYADGEEHSGVYVYDVATKVQRKVAENAVMPVWLGPRTVLVSDTKSCGDACSMSLWEPSGTISSVDVVTEERHVGAAHVMGDANVLLDVLPEPAPATTPTASPTAGPTPQETGEPTPSPTPTEPSPSPSTDPTTDPSPSPSPTPTA